MKKKLLAVLLLGYACNCFAQIEPDYPDKKLIESVKFEKAAEDIKKNLSKDEMNVGYNYAAYKLFANPVYEKYDLSTAYNHLIISKKSFVTAPAKPAEKLAKNGFSVENFSSEIRILCASALSVAEEQNSIDSYNFFLKTYLLASEEQKQTAVTNRNKIAYQFVTQENTVSAYQNFIATYPDAVQVSEAWENIYTLEFNRVRKADSENSYREFLSKYPNTQYTEIVKKRLDYLLLDQKVTRGNWQSYFNYIQDKYDNLELVEAAEDSVCNIISRDPKLDDVEYAYRNLTIDNFKNKMVLLMHDKYVDAGEKYFSSFWSNYSYDVLPDIRTKDDEISSAYSFSSSNDFIKTAAPYYCAFRALQNLIEDDLKAKNFTAVLQTVEKYRPYFGDDKNYRMLLTVLQQPLNQMIKPKVMPSAINTVEGSEYAPCISADNKTLLFCGRSRKDNLGGEDIFVSNFKNGTWQKATLIKDLNTVFFNEAPEVLSTSGNQLLLFKSGKLLYSNKTKTGWSEPEYMNDNINFASWQADPTFSSDGKVMIFAAKAKNDYELNESLNIFVSIKDENGEWGPAFDIGKNINTPFNDRMPILHPDMKTLYFGSNGHGSLGGYDFFMSKRLRDDSWTEWSEPVNIGCEINTGEDESFMKISTDGKTAYFSQTHGDKYDLVSISIPERVRPNPVATISGRLTNISGEPVSAKISWEDLETQDLIGESETNPQNGEFFIVLPEGKNYGYFIDDKNYFPTSSNIDLRKKDELIAIEKNIELVTIDEMIEKQIPIVLNNLFFNTAEWELLPESQAELRRVYKILVERNLKVEISGHTDSRSDDSYNQTLSENRANAVKEYLVKLGYPDEKLTTVGYGEKKPIAGNNTPEGRQKNRRVEMRVIQ